MGITMDLIFLMMLFDDAVSCQYALIHLRGLYEVPPSPCLSLISNIMYCMGKVD